MEANDSGVILGSCMGAGFGRSGRAHFVYTAQAVFGCGYRSSAALIHQLSLEPSPIGTAGQSSGKWISDRYSVAESIRPGD